MKSRALRLQRSVSFDRTAALVQAILTARRDEKEVS
jgi:hypothetical protein